MKPRSLVPLAVTAAAILGLATTAVVTAGAASAALTNNWYASAPYLMPLDNNPPDAVAVLKATGQKAFQLAFILAPNGGGCSPTWDGLRPVSSDTQVQGVISAIRANGGDVSVSIGGYGGTQPRGNRGRPRGPPRAPPQGVSRGGGEGDGLHPGGAQGEE